MEDYTFQDNLRNLLTWFLDPRSRVLDQEGAHRPEALAGHIAAAYAYLRHTPSAVMSMEKNPPIIPPRYFAQDREYRAPVNALYHLTNGALAPFISHGYLHGSLATEDYKKGWSDLDTFMVVRDETVRDARALLSLRKICLDAWPLFLAVTPLQHHGFIIATEYDISAYPTGLLPPSVLDSAWGMKKDQPPVRFRPRVASGRNHAREGLVARRAVLAQTLETGVYRHPPKDGVYLLSEFRNGENAMQQLFAYLGYLMTVPAYVLDAIGAGCAKRESFAKARPLFSAAAWTAIEKASMIRNAWPEKEGIAYRGNAIPAWTREMLGTDFLRESMICMDEACAVAAR